MTHVALRTPHSATCYTPLMWPFFWRRRIPKTKRVVERVIVGLIIGGAIGSIIGKKMMDKHDKDEEGKEG